MGVKWSKNQHLKYAATTRRKRMERLAKANAKPLDVVPAYPVNAELSNVGETMLLIARLGVAHRVSDRNLTGLLVHFVHVFGASQASE